MDFELSPDQQRIQTLARNFANNEVAPLAREADETGVFPAHLIGRMAALGFLGGPIAREYGGAAMDAVSFALVCEELGRADSSVRGLLTVHASLVSGCLEQWGTPEQKRVLPAPAYQRRVDRLLLSYRARRRVGCREYSDDRYRRWLRLSAAWRENLDHQRQHGASRHRLCHP